MSNCLALRARKCLFIYFPLYQHTQENVAKTLIVNIYTIPFVLYHLWRLGGQQLPKLCACYRFLFHQVIIPNQALDTIVNHIFSSEVSNVKFSCATRKYLFKLIQILFSPFTSSYITQLGFICDFFYQVWFQLLLVDSVPNKQWVRGWAKLI